MAITESGHPIAARPSGIRSLIAAGLALTGAVAVPAVVRAEPMIMIEAEPTADATHWLQDRPFDLTVTNPGTEPLSAVEVAVAMDMPPDGFAGVASAPTVEAGNSDDVLDPGETWSYTATAIVWDWSTFTVSGTTPDDDVVSQSVRIPNPGADADLLGALAISIEQLTVEANAGDDVQWRLAVSNAIGVDLVVLGVGYGVLLPPDWDDVGVWRLDDPSTIGLEGGQLVADAEHTFTASGTILSEGSALGIRFGVARADAPGAADAGSSLHALSEPVPLAATSTTLDATSTTVAPVAELPATGGRGGPVPITAALLATGAALLFVARRRTPFGVD